jgi:hypothetical protein
LKNYKTNARELWATRHHIFGILWSDARRWLLASGWPAVACSKSLSLQANTLLLLKKM